MTNYSALTKYFMSTKWEESVKEAEGHWVVRTVSDLFCNVTAQALEVPVFHSRTSYNSEVVF